MAVLTRIQNNQITDSTINAQYKVLPGSITGNLLATNVTFNSNITILGNLTVANSYTQLNSINTYINDPIVVFNNGYTGSLTGYDMGILINRNLASLGAYGSVNTAWVWSEDNTEFQAIATTETGTSVSSINNSGWANVHVGNLRAVTGTFTGNVSANYLIGTTISGSPTGNFTDFSATTGVITNFSTGNAQITGGDITNTPISGSTGYFTTLLGTNFSTANALITGGNITGITNGTFTTLQATNFSSGNAVISGGSADTFTIGLANAAAAAFTTVSTSGIVKMAGNIVGTSGTLSSSTTTGALVLTNSGGAGIGGAVYIGGILNVAQGATLQSTLNVTGQTTLSTAIAGGIQAQAIGNVTPGTAVFTTETVGGLQAQAIGNVTPGTAVFTTETVGGLQAQAIGNVTPGTGNFTTVTIDNLATANAQITSGNITGITNGAFTTLVATNFSSGNIQGTGGTLSGMTAGNFTTLQGTNFSSGNARIAGGYADNFAIGANTAATGAFTTLTASGITTVTDSTNSTGVNTGALQVTGGASVAKDLWVGGNVYANAIVSTTTAILTVQDSLVYFQAPSPNGTYNYDQGFYSDMTIGGTYQHTGVVRNHSSNVWTFFSNVASEPSGNTVNWSDSGIIYDALKAGALTLANSTASTSTSSGALVVTGGAGIGGALYAGSLHTADAAFTTLQATNFSSGNAQITGGYATGLTDVASTAGEITTLVATNFSSANARIASGYADNFAIGANTAATGAFTTLTSSGIYKSSGNIVAASGTASTSTTTGAVVITGAGGLGVGGNINAGVFNSSYHNLRGNVLIGLGDIVPTADTALSINMNPETPIVSNATVHINGFNNKSTIISLDTYGSSEVNSHITGRRICGTSDSPQAVNTGAILLGVYGKGYGTTKFSDVGAKQQSGLMIYADEDFTDTAQGTYLTLSTISRGNLVSNVGLTVLHNGNVNIPRDVYSTSPTSGAFTVKGGVGVGANLNVGGTSTYYGTANFTANVLMTSLVDTTAPDTGALVITGTGGASIGGNAFVGESIFIGATAFQEERNNATVTAVGTGTEYAQIAMINITDVGSADFIAYANNGDDTKGWADMGMTSALFNDANYTITKPNDGYFFVRPVDDTFGGNLVLATSEVGGYNDVVIAVGSFDETAEVARFHGNASTSGYLDINVGTNPTDSTDGALRISNGGGLSVSGNVFLGSAVTINDTQTANQDFIIKGVDDSTLVWARPSATYDQVVIGGNGTTSTLVQGAKLIVNSTDAMIVPVGTTADRPSNSGGTDVTGMVRYNTTLGYFEFYTGTKWQGVTTQFTIITDEQFTGDGSTVDFELGGPVTTAGTIVSINGVIQIPTLAYSVSDTTLTFTEAPASTDIIDVRRLTTTQQITALSSVNGYMGFVADNAGANITTGTSSATVTTSWEPSGAQVSYIGNVSVASANTPTTIDTIDNTKYRTAKYVIQVTNGANYQSQEVLVVSDGTTATDITYAIIQTNGNLGVVSATQSGTNTLVQFIAANATNNVRIKKDYIAI